MSAFWCKHCGKLIEQRGDAPGFWTHYASQNIWCQPMMAEPAPSVLEDGDESTARHAAR